MTDPPIVEHVPAPEILVDGFCSAMVANGVAKLAFYSLRQDNNNFNMRVVVLRLSTPLAALVGVHEAVGRMLTQIEEEAKRHAAE